MLYWVLALLTSNTKHGKHKSCNPFDSNQRNTKLTVMSSFFLCNLPFDWTNLSTFSFSSKGILVEKSITE